MDLYVDGAAAGNGKENCTGGTGYVIIKDGEIVASGGNQYLNTTNQRCELQAFLDGIAAAQSYKTSNEEYNIFSDSAYFTNCYLQNWYINWEKNGFVNSKKQAVANQDLWKEIIPYFKNDKFHFFKVKGHENNEMNNMADKLAYSNARK